MIFFILILSFISIKSSEQQLNSTNLTTKHENIITIIELVSNTSDVKENTTLQSTLLDRLNATTKSMKNLVKVKRRNKIGRKNRSSRKALRALNKERRRRIIGWRNKGNVRTTPKHISLSTLEAAVKNKTVELIQMVHDAEVYPGKVVELQHNGKLRELPEKAKQPKSRRKTRRRLKPLITVLELPYIYYREDAPVEPDRRYQLSNPDVIAEYLRVREKKNNHQNFNRRNNNVAKSIPNSQAKAAEEIKEDLEKLAGEDRLNYEDNPEDYIEEGKENNVWDYQHQDWAESQATKQMNWDDINESEEGTTTKKTNGNVKKSEKSEERQEGSEKNVRHPLKKNKESGINEKSHIEPILKSQIGPYGEYKKEQEPNDDDRTELEEEEEKNEFLHEDSKIVTKSDPAVKSTNARAVPKATVFNGKGKVEKNRIPLYTDVAEYGNGKYTTKATIKKDIIKLNDANQKRGKPNQSEKLKPFDDDYENYDQKRRPTTREAHTTKHIDYDYENHGNKKIRDKEYSDDYDRPAKPNAAKPTKQKSNKPEQVQSDESNDNTNQHSKQQMLKRIDRNPTQKQNTPKKPQRAQVHSNFRSEKGDEYYDQRGYNKDRVRKPVVRGGDDTGAKWSGEKRNPRSNEDYDSKKYGKKSKADKDDGSIDYDYDNNNKKSKPGNIDRHDRTNEYGKKSDKNAKIDQFDNNYKYDMNSKDNSRLKHDEYSRDKTYFKSHSNNKPYDQKDNSYKDNYPKERANDYDNQDSQKGKDHDHTYEDDKIRSTKGQHSYKNNGYIDTKKKPTPDEKSREDDYGGSKKKKSKDYDTPARDYYSGSKNNKKKDDFDDYDDKKNAKNDWDKVGSSDKKNAKNDWDKVGSPDKKNVKNDWDKVGSSDKKNVKNDWDKVGSADKNYAKNDWDKVGSVDKKNAKNDWDKVGSADKNYAKNDWDKVGSVDKKNAKNDWDNVGLSEKKNAKDDWDQIDSVDKKNAKNDWDQIDSVDKKNANNDWDQIDSPDKKNEKNDWDNTELSVKKAAKNDWDSVGKNVKNDRDQTRRTVRDHAPRKVRVTPNAGWDRHGNNDWDKVGVGARGRGDMHRNEGRSGGGGGPVGFGRTPLPMNRHKTLYEKKK